MSPRNAPLFCFFVYFLMALSRYTISVRFWPDRQTFPVVNVHLGHLEDLHTESLVCQKVFDTMCLTVTFLFVLPNRRWLIGVLECIVTPPTETRQEFTAVRPSNLTYNYREWQKNRIDTYQKNNSKKKRFEVWHNEGSAILTFNHDTKSQFQHFPRIVT